MCVYYHTCVVFHYSDCDKNVKGGWEGRDWIGGWGGATSVIENFTKKNSIFQNLFVLGRLPRIGIGI